MKPAPCHARDLPLVVAPPQTVVVDRPIVADSEPPPVARRIEIELGPKTRRCFGRIAHAIDRLGQIVAEKHHARDEIDLRDDLHVDGDPAPGRSRTRSRRVERVDQPPQPDGVNCITKEDLDRLEAGLSEVRQLLQHQRAAPDTREWFTVKEAAEQTSYKEYTLRQACNEGRIPEQWRQKDAGGKWRIHRDAIKSIQDRGLPKKPR